MNQFLEEHYPDLEMLVICEAGSRAWGFASPDSDYDVRFIYRHKDTDRYLRLHEPMQHCSLMRKGGLEDFSGWDIRKTLMLAAKSNFSLYEWLLSPIDYGSDAGVKEALCNYIQENYSYRDASHHYRGMAYKTYKQHVAGTGEKTLKKFLYCIRPLLCIEYMYEQGQLPPVKFEELLGCVDASLQFRQNIIELLHIKINHPERKEAPKHLDKFFTQWIEDTLEELDHDFINDTVIHKKPNWDQLNHLFRMIGILRPSQTESGASSCQEATDASV